MDDVQERLKKLGQSARIGEPISFLRIDDL